MANKKLEQGLNGLLNIAPQQEQTTVQEQKPKKAYKAVCYNLNPELIEKVKCVAYYDRKRVNEVVTEALTEYLNRWKPTQQEIPTMLKNK